MIQQNGFTSLLLEAKHAYCFFNYKTLEAWISVELMDLIPFAINSFICHNFSFLPLPSILSVNMYSFHQQKKDSKQKYQCFCYFESLLQNGIPCKTSRVALCQRLTCLVFIEQVVVVSGETGCGKTTQLPQYILESEIDAARGATCSIICTQPRRISAIAVSERVAAERGEKIGESVS